VKTRTYKMDALSLARQENVYKTA